MPAHAKLTIMQIGEIRKRMSEPNPPTQAELAKEYGVGLTTIKTALLRAPAAQPATPVTIGLSTEGSMDLLHHQLRPRQSNNRKIFNQLAIDELAESIAAKGLLQPLLVRPTDTPDIYDIIAGERRWRAIGLLVEDGKFDGPVPCIIRAADDAECLALALIENLQRRDLTVLEEGKAFVALHEADPQTYSYQAIAETIGKTVRFVQQRAAIATKLHPHFQTALTENLLNVEGARLLCQIELPQQLTILDDWQMIQDGDLFLPSEPITPEECKYAIDELERSRRREAEIAQHRTHNLRLDSYDSSTQQYAPSEMDGPLFSSLPTPEGPAPSAPPEPKAPVTKGHIYRAHNRKTTALREALAQQNHLAVKIVCFSLLHPTNSCVNILARDDQRMLEDRMPVSPNILATIDAILGKTKIPGLGDIKAELKLWRHIAGLNYGDVMVLFANLVSRHVGTFAGYDCELGDNPVAVAIANELKIPGHEADHGLTLQPDDLKGIRKATLLHLADQAGTPGFNDETKPADLAALMLKHSADFVLPTLTFATSEQIEKALQRK